MTTNEPTRPTICAACAFIVKIEGLSPRCCCQKKPTWLESIFISRSAYIHKDYVTGEDVLPLCVTKNNGRCKGFIKSSKPTWKCNWLDCAHGMGLAGMDFCYMRGADPMNPNCPKFQTVEELEAEQKARHDHDTR